MPEWVDAIITPAAGGELSVQVAADDALERCRELVRDTTIDNNTLLSTDYFNHVNEAIMLLSMVADMPDMLDEILAWQPKTYVQHFESSLLDIAPLAIQAYAAAPAEYRDALEAVVAEINDLVAAAAGRLKTLPPDNPEFRAVAESFWAQLQEQVDVGSAIVHGSTPGASLNQSAIDNLF
jgi:hypothetical protein